MILHNSLRLWCRHYVVPPLEPRTLPGRMSERHDLWSLASVRVHCLSPWAEDASPHFLPFSKRTGVYTVHREYAPEPPARSLPCGFQLDPLSSPVLRFREYLVRKDSRGIYEFSPVCSAHMADTNRSAPPG